MRKFSEFGASVALAIVIGSIAAAGTFVWLISDTNVPDSVRLPVLSIGGVTVLLIVLTCVATIFQYFGLTDKDQALALPGGSIRAVIALSLVVLFAALTVFLYQGISVGGPRNRIENVSQADRDKFMESHASAPDLQIIQNPGRGSGGASDPTASYTITYRNPNPQEVTDFANQLLVTSGTLMSAVTSFYLGARTATSAAAGGVAAAVGAAAGEPLA
ncbi:hypothetical protein B0G76_8218 [Paraburkholderia sp. BL23I1N1]|uniref:hypothetical protein n=1 Tax=Paraburkholderia sp. BL23I1N1 TaxID=1938802 RepID=UPI000FF726C4|nr:hypothetical protein [Paraburkholderia sp. BL23I1N1]RKE24336.1 hypothetical protein B0G76_8218 [Paraburkholderia sp. BL23I1N1]